MNQPEPSANREKEVFIRAMSMEEGIERETYLDEVSRRSPEVMRSVTELIEAFRVPHPLIDSLTNNPDSGWSRQFAKPSAPDRHAPGAVEGCRADLAGQATVRDRAPDADAGAGVVARFPDIPGYEIVETIGEGGFAKVYLARETGDLPRQVAIKVLKRGMDTERIVERFNAERRLLARMDHPNIAKALAGGETGDMRPYMVMDLVVGPDIIRYANDHDLPLDERLALFLDTCRGVQHAHQNGVIHRDLKPSNVLVPEVDGKPIPRIIDFGIAKALLWDPDDDALSAGHTRPGETPGTPAYMSPEQLGGTEAKVDTRTDIYALGCLLFELIAREPLVQEATGVPPVARDIRKVLPSPERKRPSTAVDDRRLARAVRGDLDAVTEKALEADPGERYQSVSELAGDIECFLAGRPVRAQAQSTAYLVLKACVRHRRGIAAAAALTITVGTGAALVVRQGLTKAAAEREIEFVSDLFNDFHHIVENHVGTDVRANYLETLIGRYQDLRSAEGVPSTDSSRRFVSGLLAELGSAYRNQGDYARARDAFQRSLAERIALFESDRGDQHAASILSGAYASLAKTYRAEGRVPEAGELFQRALELNRHCLELEPESPNYHNNLAATLTSIAMCQQMEGRIEEARRNFDEAVEIKVRLSAGQGDASQPRADLAWTLERYARFLHSLEPFDEAAVGPWVAEILSIRERRAADHPVDIRRGASLASAMNLDAMGALRVGDPGRARRRADEALARWSGLVSRDPSRVELHEGKLEAQLLFAKSGIETGALESAHETLAEIGESVALADWVPSWRVPFYRIEYFLTLGLAQAAGGRSPGELQDTVNRAGNELVRLEEQFGRSPLLESLRRRLAELQAATPGSAGSPG